MTADCAFSSENVGSGAFLYFSAGEFTINGNGHSIIGPSNTWTIFVQNAGTVLTLNNVTIRGNNGNTVLAVTAGARLNARRVTFRDNTPNAAILAFTASEGQLEDVQFLSNTVSSVGSSIMAVGNSGSNVVLTNGLFTGNTADGGIVSVNATANLSGSGITFRDNFARNVIEASALNTQATLRNVQFLNNTQTSSGADPRGSAVSALSQAAVIINNGIFRANQNVAGKTDVIVSLGATGLEGTVQLQGCIAFANNVQSDGSTAANDYRAYDGNGPVSLAGLITDSRTSGRTGGCPEVAGFISWLRPKKKAKEAEPQPTATSTPRPAYGASYVALQTATGMTFEATYGLDSGVHFRQLDGAGIGIRSIIDAGYLAALDVYGYVEQGVEVCFPQMGRVIFLDARTMPRAIMPLESTVVNGMTCVSISSPGSLVLLPN